MIKLFITVAFFMLFGFCGTNQSFGQSDSLGVKSFTSVGIQMGPLLYYRAWLNGRVDREFRLGKRLALKSGLYLHSNLFYLGESPRPRNVTATFSVVPRYYFNLVRRQKHNRKTWNNTGEFIQIHNSYRPYIQKFDGDYYDSHYVLSVLQLGTKRNIFKKLFVEYVIGLGYELENVNYVFQGRHGFVHRNDTRLHLVTYSLLSLNYVF